MEIITLKCEQCGDFMQIDERTQKAICPSCGNQKILQNKGNGDSSKKVGTAQETENETVEGLIQKAQLLLSLGEFDQAEQLYNEVINENPGDYRGYMGLLRAKTNNYLTFDYLDVIDGRIINLPVNYEELIRKASTVASAEEYEVIRQECYAIRDGILYKYMGKETCVILPSTVTTILSFAFDGSDVESNVIPNEVIKVFPAAFRGWQKHQKISVNKKNSKKWDKKWRLGCNAKIEYRKK